MEESQNLAARVEREIAASNTTSPTPRGSTEGRDKPDPALVEAINQVFALFRLNYHNQYYAAFSDEAQLRQIKKLWLDSLSEFPPVQILQGAKHAIESSDYLPTLNRMRSCCIECLGELGLPNTKDAYREACNAGRPPEHHPWSHSAVYWAGRDSGWNLLAARTETESWPVFQASYQNQAARVLLGETLPPVPTPTQESLPLTPLGPEQALSAIEKLRRENNL